MRQILIDFNDDKTEDEIESIRSLAKSSKWVAIRIPEGLTKRQLHSFMGEARRVMQGMVNLGNKTLEEDGEAVSEKTVSPTRPPIHVCDALCHHTVHQTKKVINA